MPVIEHPASEDLASADSDWDNVGREQIAREEADLIRSVPTAIGGTDFGRELPRLRDTQP